MRNKGLSSGGAFPWFFQRITGIILFFMLLLHFILMHFSGTGEITFAWVAERLRDPFWKIFDLSFLALGTYHAINGLFILLYDYIQHNALRVLITGALWTLGIVMVVVGSLTIFSLNI
jgi:succinate dehydrogenase / fumarate reductase membrane anchor subunit